MSDALQRIGRERASVIDSMFLSLQTIMREEHGIILPVGWHKANAAEGVALWIEFGTLIGEEPAGHT